MTQQSDVDAQLAAAQGEITVLQGVIQRLAGRNAQHEITTAELDVRLQAAVADQVRLEGELKKATATTEQGT